MHCALSAGYTSAATWTSKSAKEDVKMGNTISNTIIKVLIAVVIIIICENIRKRDRPLNAIGNRSERELARMLERNSQQTKSGRVLANVYVPKSLGDTAEIDVLYITRKGLLVLENKDYGGYIFGNESQKSWTQTLCAGRRRSRVEKHQFYNPVWQNNTHIKCLREHLGSDIKMFSIITFSDRSDLKSITVNKPDVFVCNHCDLSYALWDIWNKNPDVLTDDQVEELYQKLLPLTMVDEETRQKHITNIQERFNSTDTCPVCGGNLVLRTANGGSNAGNQFYGCSNYPRCRYVRDV